TGLPRGGQSHCYQEPEVMSLFSWFRRRPSRQSRRGPVRPRLETLEERCVPTVTFSVNPAWGNPTVTTASNPIVLNSAPMTVVFWGDYWQNDPTGVSQRQDLVNAASSLFPGRYGAGGYLSLEQQYRSDGQAFAVDFQNVGGNFGTPDSTNGTFTDGQLR